MSETMYRCQDSPTDTLSGAVVRAVAAHEGIDAVDVEPPLFEAVDPDALDTVFTGPELGTVGTEGQVSFAYAGYHVRVTSDGDVTVWDP